MISKELLSAVFNKTVTHIQDGIDSNDLCFMVDGETNGVFINIFELAHKCKEWANLRGKRGYTIESKVSHTLGQARVTWTEKGHTDYHGNQFELDRTSHWFKANDNSEPESIFQACQWILDQSKNTKE